MCKVVKVGLVCILGLVSDPAMELQASLCVGLCLNNDEGRINLQSLDNITKHIQ
jgi:hypothetical protein